VKDSEVPCKADLMYYNNPGMGKKAKPFRALFSFVSGKIQGRFGFFGLVDTLGGTKRGPHSYHHFIRGFVKSH